MDTLLLSRLQFALNISFHILWPSISIGLSWLLFFFKIKYRKTNDHSWMKEYQFWVKIFALCFALGVVTGVTMSFQFGTNWPGFMETVGNIAGPLLGYEVLTAFFLEASFLGIMLYGREKVSEKIHTLSTFLVAFGTTLSAFWIIALNSWMQTPLGHVMKDGKAYAQNWLQIVFNYSTGYRFTHVIIASFLTALFLVAGINACRIKNNAFSRSAKLSLRFCIYLALLFSPIQILVGDLHGLVTLKHQPAKVAAMEGIWETEKSSPLRLFAIPDSVNKKNHYEVNIPYLASLILTHSFDGEIKGLNEFKDDIPPVKPVFFGFRIMVGIGMIMLFLSFWGGLIFFKNRKIFDTFKFSPYFLKSMIVMTFSGWLATLAGWYTTEVGRQPWLVQGILKTKDSVAKNLDAQHVLFTLILYGVVYAFLMFAFLWTIKYLMKREQ
ncbi:MAG: cytochrome ubiquinol oxidase subunit I [Candidatus Puniceispirillum sp.]|nr:cytochrome ubiquinol oxidase subunit I [Candidatus Pelagibacter sp.]MBA4283118.1 cytochrome ubiquinol oxidase subunit I [Candidatus Puniceispirillum sp.]